MTVLNRTEVCRGQFSRVQFYPNANEGEGKLEESTVDYVIISNSLLDCVLDLCIDDDGQQGSDHKPLVLTMRRPKPQPTMKRAAFHETWRKPTDDDQQKFREAFEQKVSGFLDGVRSLDESVGAIKAQTADHAQAILTALRLDIYQTADEYIKRKKVFHHRRPKSWYTMELRNMKASVDCSRSVMLRAEHDPLVNQAERKQLRNAYMELNSRYLRAFRKQKAIEEQRINDELLAAEHRGDHALFWARLKQRRGYFESSDTPIAVADENGELQSGTLGAEVWRRLYERIGTVADDAEEKIQQEEPFDEKFRATVRQR